MKRQDFYYDLPEELIAQDPLQDRSGSRLLVLNKDNGSCEHRHFTDICEYLKKDDCLVINDTKVIPARLLGVRTGLSDAARKMNAQAPLDEESGAHIEVLLLKRWQENIWETIVKPGKKARVGTVISFGQGLLTGKVIEVKEDGNRMIQFSYQGIFEEILDRLGQMPLPPYITHELKDKNRYQTVYAMKEGSAAAPTAGLHFTKELLQKIEDMGIQVVHVTLHVGLGTFRPVKEDNILQHHMHSEEYEILPEAAMTINRVKQQGGRIICVGTTSCRTVEAAADENGIVHAGKASTEIFIYPGYRFKVLDHLITNFHLPESTLLMLISALAGREHILEAYRQAVEEKYRFFSFGDAMLITGGEDEKA